MIKVMFLTRLIDITKKDVYYLKTPPTLADLKKRVFELFPELKNEKFEIAVNEEDPTSDDMPLKDDDEVVFIPLPAGG